MQRSLHAPWSVGIFLRGLASLPNATIIIPTWATAARNAPNILVGIFWWEHVCVRAVSQVIDASTPFESHLLHSTCYSEYVSPTCSTQFAKIMPYDISFIWRSRLASYLQWLGSSVLRNVPCGEGYSKSDNLLWLQSPSPTVISSFAVRSAFGCL